MARSALKLSPATHYSFDVFVSYSRRNSAFVDRLVADLKDHHVSVWLDRLEIEVGDQPRRRIEAAIDACRYFLLIVSEASMRSYYVRQLELEAAFTRMIRTGRENLILPIIREHPKESLPLMLSSFHYLECTNSKKYKRSLSQLVKKIKLSDERFTGVRIYKNLDTSLTGQMVGVGDPLHQVPLHGYCVRMFYHDGIVKTMETITDGKVDGTKSVIYDEHGRVYEIVLFRDNRVVDTWRYIYDPKTGRREKKLIINPGEEPHLEVFYDEVGRRIAEKPLR
jgi:hypothetical protein